MSELTTSFDIDVEYHGMAATVVSCSELHGVHGSSWLRVNIAYLECASTHVCFEELANLRYPALVHVITMYMKS